MDLKASFDAAVAHHRAGRTAEAEQGYRAVLAAKPDHEFALQNLAQILRFRGDPVSALRLFQMAGALVPADANVQVNIARVLNLLGRHDEALLALDRALAIDPASKDALNNKGVTYQYMRRYEEALAFFDQAIACDPAFGLAIANRAIILETLGRLEAAIADYRRGLALDPSNVTALGAKLALQLKLCDWSDYAADAPRIRQLVAEGKAADQPVTFIIHTDDPAAQLSCARRYAASHYPGRPAPLWRGEVYEHDRIRVAYVSSDFRIHAVGHLVSELFCHHDRSRFEVTGYALGPRADDEVRRRIQGDLERFVDVADMDDLAVAQAIRSAETDIVIDLNGFTTHCRTGIFTYRPAPIQINYLGYPGTMGMDAYDYVIADRHVIPPGSEVHFTEKVIRLPGSYQVNSIRQAEVAPTPTRAEAGLPERAFVFASFNDNKKILPEMFDVWMRLLKAVPDSVLWLFGNSDLTVRNLTAEAVRRGVSADRLVFARQAPMDQHLARQKLADLFLDTFPYTAHTTASDALGMGLPIVTCTGQGFASRVAAGLLRELGLGELVAEDIDAYERLALQLAGDPDRLAGIRARLAAALATARVFDTQAVCRDLERAFELAMEPISAKRIR
ncbi:tetratricopeptide repeat protein [Phenylobacterium aquaticum]|uniref:O-linked N-acetylglucosamine transferase, SPINDLY family protein n=1 Tax=Phenylobacterium aquaticum TaxID=1763816 RepID=UPI001F5DD1D1|nr:tetratricopeptide repeat protein [Phenylobacterium aquaticum]MCI3131388.1 tetratricopeptide repeat protein [Phenylobacterium aquaticum]